MLREKVYASFVAVGIVFLCLASGLEAGEDWLAPLQPQPVEESMFEGHTPVPPAPDGEWTLPLEVTEQWGQAGRRYVTFGIPLLPGQAAETDELTLAVRDNDGELTAVSAQFRTLARWWRADNSIRWVLVDFQADVGNSATRTFWLTNRQVEPAEATPLAVDQNDETIVVITGPARFVVNRRAFRLLDQVSLDVNGNGNFDRDLLDTGESEGIILVDTKGNRYLASADVHSVEVIESGPQRVRVRARGINRDPTGDGYSRGMYQYDVFMDFYAGSTTVKVDLVLANNFPQSIGAPTFDDASLRLKLAAGGSGYRLYGEAPLDGVLAGDASVMLYQDSNGAETWRQAKGHYGLETSSFRGYQVLFRTPSGRFRTEHQSHGGWGRWEIEEAEDAETEQVMCSGSRARGLAHLYNDEGGLIVHTPHFWEQFPKGVEVAADGTTRVALFPGEYKVPHYFEDASGKGHELILHFYAPELDTGYPRDGAGRTWPHVLADFWDMPVFPHPPLEHKVATGALSDLGPTSEPVRGFETWPKEVHYRRMLMTDRYWGNGFGWQVFGSRWRAHGGHSRRGARQPMNEDNFLYRFYMQNDRNWWIYGNIRSRHFRDVRCYRIDGQDPFGFENWDQFRSANRSEDWTNRPQPTDREYESFSEGSWSRSTWWLPDPAHQTLDLLYDRYLLLGDQRALENMRVVAAHGGYYVAYRGPNVHRSTGWSLRALERYWELTGDAGAERVLNDALDNYRALIGQTPLVCTHQGRTNWWFTHVFSRAVAMTALHTADERALDLCKTLAVDKESRAGYFSNLFAVLYYLTGEGRYKQEVLRRTNDGDALLTVVGRMDLPAAAHGLFQLPPLQDEQE